MRPIHVLLGLVVILGSGAAAFVATNLASHAEIAQPQLPTVSTESPTTGSDAARARSTEDKLAMIAARLDAMADELESLRNSASRAPVSVATAGNAAESAASHVVVTDVQRQAVLAVLAEDRARQAAEAEAKRVEAELEAAKRRAARVAKELNLSPGDEARLADLMVESGKKRQDMFEGMRNGNFDRDTARTQMESFRTWQTDQLSVAFGAGIADQIMQTEGDRMGFGGPGGGFGGGQGAAGGGAGQGRGARRANGGAGGNAGGSGAPGAGGGQQQN